eukprot:NODE_15744_length_1033_cov_2.559603.p1 GENE.NODE_15744_length_1033_cov_2.559603~~NODE_15744_length_1033_cov_2.559603.p1  ORF type:complete len:197 (-),score=39.50 NODE_15744_length_1033_cov_2.559603:312-902(-)
MSKVPLPDNGYIPVRLADGSVYDYALQWVHYRLLPSGIGICTMNMPARLNTLTFGTSWECQLVLQHAEHDAAVKALVWTGHGRASSAGADMKRFPELPDVPEEVLRAVVSGGAKALRADCGLGLLALRCWDFPKPSLAAVNGLVIGGACNFAFLQDFVLCSSAARFLYPFVEKRLEFSPFGQLCLVARLRGHEKCE